QSPCIQTAQCICLWTLDFGLWTLDYIQYVLAENEGDAQFPAALLQDFQQAFARYGGDDVASAAYGLAAIAHVYGVPNDEILGDLLVGLVVGPLEGGQRAVGEDHAPAVGHVGRVALDDRDVVRRIGLLDEEGGIKARGTSAEDYNSHVAY